MDSSQSEVQNQEITPEKQGKQIISLGKGFILTVVLFTVLLALVIFLWQESFSGSPTQVTNTVSPTIIPKLKLNLNSNFN